MHKLYFFISRLYKSLFLKPIVTTINSVNVVYGDLLKGRKIIVTGGSEGIGFAIAKKMSMCGAEVLITGRNVDKLHRAQENVSSLKVLQWDVSDIDMLESKFNESIEVLGGIDILINNAGLVRNGKYTDRKFFEDTIRTNTEAVFCCVNMLLISLLNQLGGVKLLTYHH